MDKKIEILEGYEARIEGNKVIFEPKETEDERIRKALIKVFTDKYKNGYEWKEFGIPNRSVLDWLEKQKSEELRHSRQIALMIESARMGGVIEGRKQVIDNPEEYGLCKLSRWSKEDEKHITSIFDDFKQDVVPDEEDQEWLKNRLKHL